MSRARDRADSSPTISGDLTVSGDLVPSTALSHRNMIINGGMVVNQRGETPNKNSTTLYAADRWKPQSTGLDQCDFTFTQSSTDAPTDKGFDKSLRLLMGTAESSTGVNEYLRLRYVIESNELRPLCFGTPSAKNFTLSFWVRSSVTQTWAGNIAESSGSKNIGFTFSIDAANTWEKKEITFVGNTHDVPPLNNTAGLYIYIYLAAGTNHYGTANTTWAAATATTDNAQGRTQRYLAGTQNLIGLNLAKINGLGPVPDNGQRISTAPIEFNYSRLAQKNAGPASDLLGAVNLTFFINYRKTLQIQALGVSVSDA